MNLGCGCPDHSMIADHRCPNWASREDGLCDDCRHYRSVLSSKERARFEAARRAA